MADGCLDRHRSYYNISAFQKLFQTDHTEKKVGTEGIAKFQMIYVEFPVGRII